MIAAALASVVAPYQSAAYSEGVKAKLQSTITQLNQLMKQREDAVARAEAQTTSARVEYETKKQSVFQLESVDEKLAQSLRAAASRLAQEERVRHTLHWAVVMGAESSVPL